MTRDEQYAPQPRHDRRGRSTGHPGAPRGLPDPHRPGAAALAFWRSVAAGEVDEAELAHVEAMARQARITRARQAMLRLGPKPARWDRPAPRPSRQYAGPISTEAARDDRLTPNAKSLLTLLRARCGKGVVARTCKTTLAHMMRRSPRSIQRYLRDLRRFGYIATTHRTNAIGMDTGLVVRLLEPALPFFQRARELADWLHETGRAALATGCDPRVPMLEPTSILALPIPATMGETILSPINVRKIESPLERALLRLGQGLIGRDGISKPA